MTWQREQKRAKRAKRGVRRGLWGGVIPPSLGRCYLEVEEKHLERLEELVEFVEERGGRFVMRQYDDGDAKERMLKSARLYGYRRMVDKYLIEIDDNDIYLVEFALWFD